MAASQPHTPAPAATGSGTSRNRDLLLRVGPWLTMAAWIAVVTGVLLHFGYDSHYVFTDEVNAVLLGRFMENDFFSLLFEGNVARGPERMTSWMSALAAWLSDDPTRQFQLLHAMAALAQALIVVPIWMAARLLGMGRWAALLPATIASAGCFAFYGIMTLNTSVGMLSCCFMLWAMLRTLRRPGVLSDVLVGVTLGTTVLARIGWAPLIGALVPATLATIWFARPAGERLVAWLRALPLRLLRRHPLLTPAAGAFVVALLIVGIDPLVGGQMYGGVRLSPDVTVDKIWDNTRILFSHIAIGTGLVPFVLALPLLVRAFVKPTDPVEAGLAWITLGYVVIFSYAYYDTVNEDRYFAVVVTPFVLAGALALVRRPPPLWSVLLSGAGTTWLVVSSYRWPVGDVFTYFTAPTSRFFGDLVLGRLSLYLPGSRTLLAILVLVVAALAALALTFLVRNRPGPRLLWGGGAVVLAGVLAWQLAGMYHPALKFTDAVAMSSLSADQLEFIDATVEDGDGEPEPLGTAQPLATDGAPRPDIAAQMPFLQVFNSALGYGFQVERDGGAPPPEVPVPHAVSVDWRSGDVEVGGPIPEVLVTSAGQETLGFDSEALPPQPEFPWAGLERLRDPLVAEWMVRDDLPDRFADPDAPMRVRVYPHGDQRCLSGLVNQHPLSDRRVRYRIEGGVNTPRGVVNPGTPLPFRVRLRGDRPTTLVVRGTGGRLPDGTLRAPAVFNLVLDRCRG